MRPGALRHAHVMQNTWVARTSKVILGNVGILSTPSTKYWSHYGAILRSMYYRYGGQVLALPEHGTNPWGDKCKCLDPNE